MSTRLFALMESVYGRIHPKWRHHPFLKIVVIFWRLGPVSMGQWLRPPTRRSSRIQHFFDQPKVQAHGSYYASPNLTYANKGSWCSPETTRHISMHHGIRRQSGKPKGQFGAEQTDRAACRSVLRLPNSQHHARHSRPNPIAVEGSQATRHAADHTGISQPDQSASESFRVGADCFR